MNKIQLKFKFGSPYFCYPTKNFNLKATVAIKCSQNHFHLPGPIFRDIAQQKYAENLNSGHPKVAFSHTLHTLKSSFSHELGSLLSRIIYTQIFLLVPIICAQNFLHSRIRFSPLTHYLHSNLPSLTHYIYSKFPSLACILYILHTLKLSFSQLISHIFSHFIYYTQIFLLSRIAYTQIFLLSRIRLSSLHFLIGAYSSAYIIHTYIYI